jgi:hypothetical protein
MSWLLVAAAIVVCSAAGAMLLNLVWPERAPTGDRLFRSCLSAGLGLGLTSGTTYAWLHLPGHNRAGLVALDVTVAGLLGVGALLARRGAGGMPHGALEANSGVQQGLGQAALWLRALAVLSVVLGGLATLSLVAGEPHGHWDAWGIWNLRARFLFLGDDGWTDAFHPVLRPIHLDYPLLVPLTVARLWAYQGGDSTLAPQMLTLAFMVTTAGALFGLLRAIKGAEQAWLGLLVLVALEGFLLQAAGQCADVPTGFFLLCAIGLLTLARGRADDKVAMRLRLLAGFSLGCSAWTKNEGRLMLVSGVAAVALVGWVRGRTHGAWRDLRPVLLGAAPFVLMLALKQYEFPASNDIMGSQNRWTLTHKPADPARHLTILRFGWERILLDPKFPFVPLLAVTTLVLGRDLRRDGAVLADGAVTLLLVASGFYFVYLVTPHPLEWHLATSAQRLLVQLWPSAVLLALVRVRSPGEAMRPDQR